MNMRRCTAPATLALIVVSAPALAVRFDEDGAKEVARIFATASYIAELCPERWTRNLTLIDGMFTANGFELDRIADDRRVLNAAAEQTVLLKATAPTDPEARRNAACRMGEDFGPDAVRGTGRRNVLLGR